MTLRRRRLACSLLSSTKVRGKLASGELEPEHQATSHLSPLLEATGQHSLNNVHRLAYGVTSFPFLDPSPEMQTHNPLLGIRIDVCDRRGRFDEGPYRLFCVQTDKKKLRIHRHTIPAFVPLERYEREYLAVSDDGGRAGAGASASTSDLHTLVHRVRHDLVAWRLRRDAIDWVKEELGISEAPTPSALPRTQPDGAEADDDASDSDMASDIDNPEAVGRFGVSDFSAVTVDARQARIVWADGRVGRIKISDQGKVEKAVVIGHEGRIRQMENILTTGNSTVYDLAARLAKLDKSASMKRFSSRHGS